MGKLIVSEWLTLDGIFDAGSIAEWFTPFDSEERREYIVDTMAACEAILFGRASYDSRPTGRH